MKKENNQADLFSDPAEKKEDAMKQEEKGSKELIEKVRAMSAALKFKPGGTHHPDRLKEDEILNLKS